MLALAWTVIGLQIVWGFLVALLMLSAGCSGDVCDAPDGWFIATVGYGQFALLPFTPIAALYLLARALAAD